MSLISRPIFDLGLPAASATFTTNGQGYDCALGNIGLLRADSKQYPAFRATAPYRKDQFDTSSDPGEQTLSQWWVRSQTDFGGGAGIKFMEPSSDADVMISFMQSKGINPWTPGDATLLRDVDQRVSSGATAPIVMGCSGGATDQYMHADGTTLYRVTAGSATALSWGGTGTILALANDGFSYYAADATGIYKGDLAGGTGTLKFNTGSSTVVLGWAKQRLVACIGASVYELTGAGPALPTALYTHPVSNWNWTSIAEGPGAIYASGYSGTTSSAIYKFVLNSSGVMPTLTSGIVACRMPPGEIIYSIESYLGTFLAIGTSKGVRIGIMAANGDISYGPLVIESTQPVKDLVGRDRFIYATCTSQIDGVSGLWRIDLGSPRSDGSFPYATDIALTVNSEVTSVSTFGATDRMSLAVSGQGSFLESATTLVPSGYLRTGYIRFNTTEDKRFLYGSIRGKGPGGFNLATVDAAGNVVSLVSGLDGSGGDLDLSRRFAEEYLALQITLTRATTTTGPTLGSWQVKALPALTRSRQLRIPIMLFEHMRNSKGSPVPKTDVHETLAALEALENEAAPVLFYDLAHPTPRTELVVIDGIEFQQTSPPARAKGEGGVAVLTLRTVR